MTFTAIDIYRHDKFDMENFAFAYASLLAAGAAGVKIKETTEPTAASVMPQIPVVPNVGPGQVTVADNTPAPVSPAPVVTPTPAPITQPQQQNVQVTVITDDDIPPPPKP